MLQKFNVQVNRKESSIIKRKHEAAVRKTTIVNNEWVYLNYCLSLLNIINY
jgi:hypothetical protein